MALYSEVHPTVTYIVHYGINMLAPVYKLQVRTQEYGERGMEGELGGERGESEREGRRGKEERGKCEMEVGEEGKEKNSIFPDSYSLILCLQDNGIL